jgi:adenylate kinase
VHFSSGDAFRSLTPESRLGKLFFEFSSRGKLVPDEPTIEIFLAGVESFQSAGRFDPAADTLVLDGIPRNVPQAEILKNVLEVRKVINLSCSNFEELVARLQKRAIKEGRFDDANVEVIRERLQTYERETKPLLDFYGPQLVRNVDALQKPIKVLLDTLEVTIDL